MRRSAACEATSSGRRLPSLVFALISSVASATPGLQIQPAAAKPGDPVLITLRGIAFSPEARLGDQHATLQPIPGGFQGLIALPLETKPGRLEARVSFEASPSEVKHTELSGVLEIIEPNYPAKQLTVDNKFVEPPPEVKARIEADKLAFAKAMAHPLGPRQFAHDFSWPRPPVITAPFGDLRVFNGEKKSQHYGVDLNGRISDPISAANDGRVVMVRDCYSSGNTTIVDHGLGLFTLYFHQSKILVHEGQTVKRGQRIGLVGRTGRVTGPHLHWGVKIGELYVDGATLMKLKFE